MAQGNLGIEPEMLKAIYGQVNSNKSKIKVIRKSLINAITSDLNSITKKPVV